MKGGRAPKQKFINTPLRKVVFYDATFYIKAYH